MTLDEIRDVLDRAAAMRMPQRHPDDGRAKFIDDLTDYILKCAEMRGELIEARTAMELSVELLEDKWARIEGWQALAGAKPTQAAIEEAKRSIDPETWQGIRDGKRLIERLTVQVKRLTGMADDEAASRVYTLLTG